MVPKELRAIASTAAAQHALVRRNHRFSCSTFGAKMGVRLHVGNDDSARGLLVSVAQVHVVRDLRLIDLHKPVRRSNPFTDDMPRYKLELEHLLRAFGEELSRPLRRTDDHHEYLPCQKLVERIRESNLYDGIRYPSAMAPGGSNIVLFESNLVTIGASRLVEIREIDVSYADFEDE